MGRLSAHIACHHCDVPAPTGDDGFFTYLTAPDEQSETTELQPSCPGHADYMILPDRSAVMSLRSGRIVEVAA